MGKKMKERKNTKISPDYISATAGNSGILRDMAGHFTGTGRYVVPTITAACAMQGTVMPVCQVQAAVVIPADNATIGSGGSMTLPDYGISAVTSVNVNSAGSMTVKNGGLASNTTISGGTVQVLSGGVATSTLVDSGGYMRVSSGGSLTFTTVEGATVSALSGLVMIDGGSANVTEINSGGVVALAHSAIVTSTTINDGGLLKWSDAITTSEKPTAISTIVNSGGSMTAFLGAISNTMVNGGTLEVGAKTVATTTDIENDGIMRVYGSASNTTVNSGSLTVRGGRAEYTTVNSDGFMSVVSSGHATSTTVNGGLLEVVSGGAAATTVDNGGTVTVMGGSTTWQHGGVQRTMLINGTLLVSSGGVASSTNVSSNGAMFVLGGSARSATISGGSMSVSSGGVVVHVDVNNGGNMVVEKGLAVSSTVNNANLTVSSGGIASGTIVDLDSTMMVVGGSANKTKVNSGGSMTLADGSATNTTLSGGSLAVLSGGLATSTTVDSGGSMTVSSGGAASSTDIINGGSVTVDAGSATDTNISSGIMEVISGGSATDTTVYNGGSLSVTDSSTVNNVVLSGGIFLNPTAGSTAIISGTVSGEGDITGPGDFTLDNGNILLTSGSVSTTGTLTVNKILDTSKPAVSATTVNFGSIDVTNLDAGASTSGALIKADTALPAMTLTSGTDSGVLSSTTPLTFGGGAHTDTSVPGFTLDYTSPSATYSMVNSDKEIAYSLSGSKQATKLTFGSIDWLNTGAFIDHTTQFADVIFNGADVDTSHIHFKNVAALEANKTMKLVNDFGTSVGTIIGTKYTVGTTLEGKGKAYLDGSDLMYKVETKSQDTSSGGGGSSGNGSNNTVNITTGTHTGNIYGGYSSGGKTENNVVNLYGPADVSGANLIGGSNGYKGNILNIGDATKTPWTGGNQCVQNISNFERINFDVVPWNPNRPALTITDGSLSNLSYTTVSAQNVYFTGVDVLSKWDKMTLLNAAAIQDAGRRLSAANVIPDSNYTVGTTGQGTGTLSLDGNGNVIYRVDTYDDGTPIVTAQEQTHNTLMGMEAGLAVINSGQDFIEKAVDGLGEARNIGKDGISVFAAMGGGKDRYETGSHINLNTWNGIVGVGKSHQLANGKFQWGGFIEHGSGKFSLYNGGSAGDGSSTYTGGGVAAKWINKHDVYVEAGLRYGRAHDTASNILQDALGNYYGYNVHANYYGGFFGLGKVYRLGENRSLDVYGKFYHTHRNGVSFDAGGQYDLDGMNSNILRVGAKYREKIGKFSWYGGLAYEHEFGGEATGRADGMPIRAASIKGGSLRADLGISMKPSEKSPWTMELGITGHTGKHRGIRGNLLISCKF